MEQLVTCVQSCIDKACNLVRSPEGWAIPSYRLIVHSWTIAKLDGRRMVSKDGRKKTVSCLLFRKTIMIQNHCTMRSFFHGNFLDIWQSCGRYDMQYRKLLCWHIFWNRGAKLHFIQWSIGWTWHINRHLCPDTALSPCLQACLRQIKIMYIKDCLHNVTVTLPICMETSTKSTWKCITDEWTGCVYRYKYICLRQLCHSSSIRKQ